MAQQKRGRPSGSGKHQQTILSKLEERVTNPSGLPFMFLKELHGSRSRQQMRALARAARKLEAAGHIIRVPVWYPLPISPERRRMILVALPETEFLGCPIEEVLKHIAIIKDRNAIEQAVFEYEILYFIKSEKGESKPFGVTPKEFVKSLNRAEQSVMLDFENRFLEAWGLDRDSYEHPADLAMDLFSRRIATITNHLKSAEAVDIKSNPIKGDGKEGNKRHPIKGSNNDGKEVLPVDENGIASVERRIADLQKRITEAG